jgi:hypothetical protein
MPDRPPPTGQAVTPHRFLLPAGSVLWRIHARTVDATEFTGRRGRLTSGRFDGRGDRYNAGRDARTLVADLLLRGIPFSDKGFRTVRRARIAGKRASAVSTSTELSLVSLLTTPALTAVGQDTWLVFAEDRHWDRTGEWADWLHDVAPWAHGIIWPTEHDHGQSLVVLFGGRCTTGVLNADPEFALDLDDEYGAVWLNGMLVHYRARVMPPRKG